MLRHETRFLRHWLAQNKGNTAEVATAIEQPVRTWRDRLHRCGLDSQEFR